MNSDSELNEMTFSIYNNLNSSKIFSDADVRWKYHYNFQKITQLTNKNKDCYKRSRFHRIEENLPCSINECSVTFWTFHHCNWRTVTITSAGTITHHHVERSVAFAFLDKLGPLKAYLVSIGNGASTGNSHIFIWDKGTILGPIWAWYF